MVGWVTFHLEPFDLAVARRRNDIFSPVRCAICSTLYSTGVSGGNGKRARGRQNEKGKGANKKLHFPIPSLLFLFFFFLFLQVFRCEGKNKGNLRIGWIKPSWYPCFCKQVTEKRQHILSPSSYVACLWNNAEKQCVWAQKIKYLHLW